MMELGCDSVQVVATAHYEGDLWAHFFMGKVNLYARHGAVRHWLNNQDEMSLANGISKMVDMGGGYGDE